MSNQKELSTAELSELYAMAIRISLDIENSFKLHSYRITDQTSFIKRLSEVSDDFLTTYNKITENGTATIQLATKQQK